MRSCRDVTARARLRDAALALFAERGVDQVSVREIAAAAGVTHGLVRHHFEGKDGLVAAVNEHAVERIREALAIASDIDTQGNGEQLAASIASRRRRALEEVSWAEPQLARYVARRVMEPERGGRELFAALADALAENLADLRTAGVVREDIDVEMVAGQLLALELGGLMVRDVLDSWLGGSTTDRWWSALESLLDRGLYRPTTEG